MFFSGCLGTEAWCRRWRRAFETYGQWLGLEMRAPRPCDLEQRQFAYGWLVPTAAGEPLPRHESESELVLAPGGGRAPADEPPKRVQLRLDKTAGALEVRVPPCTPEQFTYTRGEKGICVCNDVRFLKQWADEGLCEAAVFALLQYGAVPAPLTIAENVRRVPGGHRLRAEATGAPELTKTFRPAPGRRDGQAGRPENDRSKSSSRSERDAPEEQVRAPLDRVLRRRVPEGAALYFSGGVDSALLAWRLSEMGRTDVTLYHYAFEPAEGRRAARMAAHLGMNLEQVSHEAQRLTPILESLGRDYSYPFGDLSLLPTNMLARATLERAGSLGAVVDGTGADGAFGIATKLRGWQRVYGVPAVVRRGMAWGYGALGLWRSDGRAERVVRLLRRSAQMPLDEAAVIAQNPLDGIAYRMPADARRQVQEALTEHIQALGKGLAREEQWSLLDLVHVCAGQFAAKTYDPLRRRGVEALYPYLDPEMARLALSLKWNAKSRNGEDKLVLKRLLAQGLPEKWAFRPPDGFAPPPRATMAAGPMQSFLRGVVLSERNPLLRFVKKPVVREMVERASKKRPMGTQTYNFLWALVITAGWVQQQEAFALDRRQSAFDLVSDRGRE